MAWLRAALELLVPSLCAGCGRAVRSLPLCPACRLPEAGPLGPPPTPLTAWCAATLHEGPGAEWVRRFKYPARGLAGLDAAAEAVALAAIRALGKRVPGTAPTCVVPIALHPRRLRERGFSPAALLARALAREVRVPFEPTRLARVIDTRSQTTLSRAERRANVAGAFVVRGPAPARIWLVDDVVTTGSTLAEAARTLRRAGAREVVAVCLAWRPLLG